MVDGQNGHSQPSIPTNGNDLSGWSEESMPTIVTSAPSVSTDLLRTELERDAVLDQTQTLTEAWSLLKEQQDEFERRSQQLQILRDKLARHLEQQNHALLSRQRELDVQQQQSDRERGYLQNAKLHLRRMMKEHTAQLQQLNRKRNELSDYETRIHPDDAAAPLLDAVAEEYQQQIDLLLKERYSAQERIRELHRQITEWSDSSASAPHLFHPRPTDLKFGCALLVGLAVGLLLSYFTDFHYFASMIMTADGRQTDAQQLESHRLAFAQSLALTREQSPPSSQLQVLSITTDLEQPALIINAQTVQADTGRRQLREAADNYLAQLQQQQQQNITALEQERLDLAHQIELGQQEYELVLTRLSNEELAIDIENPREELHHLYTGIASARRRFNQLRTDLEAAQESLQQLQQTEIPNLPPISDALLQQALARDTYLVQDREALRVRLNQLRKHLLEVFQDSPETIRKFQTTINELSGYVETQKMNVDDRRIIAELDDFGAKAADLAQLAADFEKRWLQYHKNLRDLVVDPARRDALDLQSAIEEQIKDFNEALNEQLTNVQKQYQRFSQSLNNPAEHFQLLTGLAKSIKTVVEAQMTFAGLARRALPRSDFQLDAVIHSAVGFTRRIHTRQADIELQLSLARREDMLNELKTRISEQQLQIASLTRSRDAQLDELLDLQDQLHRLIPYISEFGATDQLVRQNPAQAEQLLNQIESLREQEQTLIVQTEHLRQTPLPLQLSTIEVATWPMDASARLSQNTVAGAGAALITYLLLMLIRRPRLKSHLPQKATPAPPYGFP